MAVENIDLMLIWYRMLELVQAPVNNPDMMWIVTPLVIALFAMQFYFGRYGKEELGWNSAVANSLILIFVSLDLFRFVYNYSAPSSSINLLLYPIKTLIAFIIIMEGICLFFADFLHFLPRKLAFLVSSSLPVNLQAYIGLALVYTDIALDKYTLFAAILLFVILLLFFTIMKAVERTLFRKKKK